VRRGGIQPVDTARWWRFRLPGSGVIDWKGFFTALADAGYTGGLNIENEDQLGAAILERRRTIYKISSLASFDLFSTMA
jgi:sugar phosphate isomerase/epimerase